MWLNKLHVGFLLNRLLINYYALYYVPIDGAKLQVLQFA